MDYFEILVGLYLLLMAGLIATIWEVERDYVKNRRLQSRIRRTRT